MTQKWYLLNDDFERYAGPYTEDQLRSMYNKKKVGADTNILSTDGVGMDVGSLILHGYSFLSHRQRAYLKFLGYAGSMYISQDDCSYAIQRLKAINPYGVDNLNFDTLVETEERRGDAFFLEAEQYIQKNGYDSLPPELRQPKKASALYTFLAFVFRVICAAARGIFKFLRFATKKAVEHEKEHKTLQETFDKIKVFVSNNVPLVVSGVLIALVSLVFFWLVRVVK